THHRTETTPCNRHTRVDWALRHAPVAACTAAFYAACAADALTLPSAVNRRYYWLPANSAQVDAAANTPAVSAVPNAHVPDANPGSSPGCLHSSAADCEGVLDSALSAPLLLPTDNA